MTATWFANLVLLFQPEDSSRLAQGEDFLAPAFSSLNEKSPAPAKALLWTLISIMAGLIIGQLS
jgi:hypothetical protein